MKHKLIKVLSLMMALTMLMGSLVLTVGATDCAHETMDVVSEVAATCTTYGYTVKKCADCGYQVTTPTEKVEHEYATVPAVAPTCSVAGNVEYQGCVHCGKPETGTKNDYVDPATGNHDWELFVDEPGTGFFDEDGDYNTENGRLYKRCTMCGDEEVIEVFGQDYWGDSEHVYVFTITQEPTCITNGYATYSCAHCNQKWENIYVAPNATYGHSFTKDLALNSTCKGEDAENHVVKVCAYCDMPEETLPTTLDCNWVRLTANDAWTLANNLVFQKAKTCTEDGYVVYKCTNAKCGEYKVYVAESDDANQELYRLYGKHEGHKKSGTPTLGTGNDVYCSYYTCSVCSEVFPVDTTHNWATDTAANRTSGKYVVSGTVGAVTLGEPTCYNQGKAQVYCLDCTAYKIITLAPLGHKMDKYDCETEGCTPYACTDCTHKNRTVECSRTNCDEANKAVTALAAVTAHDIAGGTDVVVRPTCLSKGYTQRVCGNAGCTSNVKVEGSETAKDPNYHENFSIKQGTFTWGLATSEKYRCDNPTFEWICACTGTEKTLDMYADYDFLADNLKYPATLTEFKAKVTDAAEFFADTNKTTLKAKDTFKGKGHEEHTTFKPKTDNKDNRLGTLAWIVEQSFYGAAIETNILTVDNVYYTDVKAGTTLVDRNVGLTATTATCSDFGNTEGKICVRCGETTVKPTGIAKNASNHLTQAGALRQNVTLVSYRPATCTIAELVKYDCVCGAKNVEWLGTTDNTVNGHFTYTFNTGYNVEGVGGADLAAKIATIKADYITKSFGDRVFTAYKAADCFTAGNHANLMCEICEKTYAITPVKNAIANADKTGFTTEGGAAAVNCDVFGCSCKKAKSDNSGAEYKTSAADLATIAVVIPALNHYGFAEKSAFNETIKDAANGWRQVAKHAETCFADGYNAFKVCKICESKTNAADTANNIAEGVNYNNKYVNQLYADNKIVAHGSANWTYTAAKAPTCTQDGVTQNQYCSKCEKYYLNATATTTPIQVNYEGNPNPDKIANITVATTAKINRLGHTMTTPAYFVLSNGVWVPTMTTPSNDCTTSFFAASICVNPACDAFNGFNDFDKDGHADISTDRFANEVSFYLNNYYAAPDHVFDTPDLPENFDFTKAPEASALTGDKEIKWTKKVNNVDTTVYSKVYFREVGTNVCEKYGEYYVKCDCGAELVIATVAPAGHKDWQGNALAVNCANDGKLCTVCNTTIDSDCVNKVKVVVKAATCEEDGITLYACTLCGKEYGANGTTPLANLSEAAYNAATKTNKINHSIVTVFTESYVEPTLQNEGSIKILCANCGEVVCKLDKLTDNDIYFTVVPYNPVVGVLPSGTAVPQGGMFKITLMMNSGMVYNALKLDLELPYDMELVDYEFKLESDPLLAVKNSVAVIEDVYYPGYDVVRILSTVTGSDKQNVVIDGERVVFAELYVKALSVELDDWFYFEEQFEEYSYIDGKKVDAEGNVTNINDADFVMDYTGYIESAPLFDANINGIVDEGDMIAIVGDLVAGVLGEDVVYNAAADIDRDGKLTINDLQYLEKYLLTKQTLADYINVYLMAMSAGETTLADKIAATDLSKYDWDGDGKEGTSADARAFEEDILEMFEHYTNCTWYENYYEFNIEYMVDNLIETYVEYVDHDDYI